MYTTSSIAPLSIVHRLVKAGMLRDGSKVVLVSSEAGSIALRTSAEMNYGHHGSKAALNMVGRLLSFDLRDKKIVVAIVHPGFMRTDMTRSVGLDQVYERFHGAYKSYPLDGLCLELTRVLQYSCRPRRGRREFEGVDSAEARHDDVWPVLGTSWSCRYWHSGGGDGNRPPHTFGTALVNFDIGV